MMRRFFIAAFFLTLIMVLSCKKKNAESVLGLDVQPGSDLLNVTVTDTSTIYMHTISTDSVRAYNDRYKILGSNQDPVFGRVDASIYTNFSLPNNITGVSFGTDPHIDHAEIRMRITGQYIGDTASIMHYDVFSIQDQLSTDSIYYTKDSMRIANTPICSVDAKIRIVQESSSICLVLPVDKFYAEAMMQNTNFLTDNTTFLQAYKGFYITSSHTSNLNPSGHQGALIRYDLEDDASGLFIYYRNGTNTTVKPKEFQFTFKGTDALRFNRVQKSNSGAITNLVAQLGGDTAKGAQDIYLQGFGLTKAKMSIPYLTNFSDSQHVIINRAEITFKVDEITSPASTNYNYPPAIVLVMQNKYGREAYVKDLYYNSIIQFGGTYDATNKQFVFDIARQVQDIVDRKTPNYGFYLVQADNNALYLTKRDDRLERVVIGGYKNPTCKPKFKLTYIKYPYDKK